MSQFVQHPRIDPVQFEVLLSRLKQADGQGDVSLLVEHLQTAESDYLGAMPLECAVNLEMARSASRSIPDKQLRDDCERVIGGMLEVLSESSSASNHVYRNPSTQLTAEVSSSAQDLIDYFRGTSVRLGTFYPIKHIVAVFHSLGEASQGQQRLFAGGMSGKHVLAASGHEFEQFLDQLNRSFLGTVMSGISRVLDTEANLEKEYLEWAHAGCGFLIANSPAEEGAGKIAGELMGLDPIAVHWFAAQSIHSFV